VKILSGYDMLTPHKNESVIVHIENK